MALSKTLVQPFRKNMLLIGAGYRAFFAPYNATTGSAVANTAVGPTMLDLQTAGPFNSTAPPAGWSDLGWVKDFKITPASKIGQVRSGYRGAVRAQYRGQVAESFEFKFRESSRMAWKIATGSDPFNLLNGATPTTAGPLSASGAPKTGLVSYTPGTTSLTVANASAIGVSGGMFIVADDDYNPAQFGIIGSAGVPVFKQAVTDIDYIRKTSDFVARVVAVNGNVLTIDQPFVGGGSTNQAGNLYTSPNPGTANVQVISGWAAREGGTYITEWSALCILDTIDQAQIAFYFPHVSISQFRDVGAWAIENVGTTDLTGYELDCVMECLAFDDPLDGETVVGYTAFYARPGQAAAI
jgi:hypothetical protein